MYIILLLLFIIGILVIYQGMAMYLGLSSLRLTKAPQDSLTHQSILNIITNLNHPTFEGVCYGFTLNWAHAVAENKENFFYQQLHLLRTHQTNLPSTIQKIQQKKRDGQLISKEEECIETLPDLLKRICIAQDPLKYRKKYGKLVWQPDINPILQTITPLPTHVRQIFYKTHTFSSRQVGIEYFNHLIKLGLNEKIAVMISTADHAMGFQRAGNVWRFININDLYQQNSNTPYFEFTSEELVKELYRVSTDGPLTRRLTVNTDYIAIANQGYHQLLKPLKNLFPVFPIAQETTYSEKLSFFAMAAFQGDIPTVKKCMKAGLSIFSNHHINENSPILTAIHLGRREVVRAMMSSIKHRINYRNKTDLYTLLHVACKYGHSGIVEDLLNIKGVMINAQDKEGQTPLMRACRSTLTVSEPKLFKLLLARNASLTITDKDGFTALDHAQDTKNEIAINILQKKLQTEGLTKSKPELTSCSITSLIPSFFNKKQQQIDLSAPHVNKKY